uniref:Ras-related protein Rab n=1 Tax=Neogobius melanostomus TaxID=47308 RepID=A0A8C6TQJ3_9GOBI
AGDMQQELLFKTSIIKRYVHQIFSQHYRATIGVDFALKVIQWDNNTVVRLQLWDIAGQERYGNMTRVYYREAVGAMVVFDVTRASTFEAVLKWKDDLDSKVTLNHGRPVPVVLLANKSDQLPSHSPKLDTFCRENGFVAWFETSAKVSFPDFSVVLRLFLNMSEIYFDARPEETCNTQSSFKGTRCKLVIFILTTATSGLTRNCSLYIKLVHDSNSIRINNF